jgi:F0F1-type ATP synthase epsilon subunit
MAERDPEGAPPRTELALSIRTPHETVFEGAVRGLRVPTESGQVGLRPRGEPLALVVEPGIVLVHVVEQGAELSAGTVGGLLRTDGARCELFTPLAVVGSADEVVAALERQGETPDAELAARRRLGELEQRIITEMKRPRTGRGRGGRG